MQNYTALSLFCGAGGMDIGFERAGFHTIWANDFDKDACQTYQSWSKAEVICGDVSKIDVKDIPDGDVILGGFPCQGFSLSGPRKIDDNRNKLYQHYVRIVEAKNPMMLVGENVKGLLTMGDGAIIEAIIEAFADCGYDMYYKLLNAKHYEVPEDRERVIIVGFRKDLHIQNFTFPEEKEKIITLKEALAEIPYSPDETCWAPYSSRYMSRNRKRGWDEVSYTIPAMAKQVTLHPSSPDMIKLGKDEWIFGEGETRRLSWREAAAIQTFPPELEFSGNLTSQYKQIGNAVPCRLAEIIALHLNDVLTTALNK